MGLCRRLRSFFLAKPKKKPKGENDPGAAEAARRVDVANSSGYQNKNSSVDKGKGRIKGQRSPCLRCGGPNHYRDCPNPWGEVLDTSGKQKGASPGKGKPPRAHLVYGKSPVLESEEGVGSEIPLAEESPLPDAEDMPALGNPTNQTDGDPEEAAVWWVRYYPDYGYTAFGEFKFKSGNQYLQNINAGNQRT